MPNTTEATITISGWGDSESAAVANLVHELRNLADQMLAIKVYSLSNSLKKNYQIQKCRRRRWKIITYAINVTRDQLITQLGILGYVVSVM